MLATIFENLLAFVENFFSHRKKISQRKNAAQASFYKYYMYLIERKIK